MIGLVDIKACDLGFDILNELQEIGLQHVGCFLPCKQRHSPHCLLSSFISTPDDSSVILLRIS